MQDDSRKRLKRATIVFWVLLLYIITALLWWLVSLENQNKEIHQLKREEIRISDRNSLEYHNALIKIKNQEDRNTVKYVSEGVIFLLLIIFGAIFIYRSVRRQFALQQQQQNFVMAVTHELKTPISISRLNLETLQRYQLDEAKEKKLLQSTLTETLRLDRLINNILVSSQLDSGNTLSKEEINFSHLVQETIDEFKNRHQDKNVIHDIQEEIDFNGDPLLLKLLISNLLENANKYAAKETGITCILNKEGKKINLQVIDEGYGISDDEKKNIFEKFYRIGNEQTRTTQGTGLGLYLSKKIAQSHGGDISVKNNQPQGSNFTVQFFA
jgi:signal transduction histidine kinase